MTIPFPEKTFYVSGILVNRQNNDSIFLLDSLSYLRLNLKFIKKIDKRIRDMVMKTLKYMFIDHKFES